MCSLFLTRGRYVTKEVKEKNKWKFIRGVQAYINVAWSLSNSEESWPGFNVIIAVIHSALKSPQLTRSFNEYILLNENIVLWKKEMAHL